MTGSEGPPPPITRPTRPLPPRAETKTGPSLSQSNFPLLCRMHSWLIRSREKRLSPLPSGCLYSFLHSYECISIAPHQRNTKRAFSFLLCLLKLRQAGSCFGRRRAKGERKRRGKEKERREKKELEKAGYPVSGALGFSPLFLHAGLSQKAGCWEYGGKQTPFGFCIGLEFLIRSSSAPFQLFPNRSSLFFLSSNPCFPVPNSAAALVWQLFDIDNKHAAFCSRVHLGHTPLHAQQRRHSDLSGGRWRTAVPGVPTC